MQRPRMEPGRQESLADRALAILPLVDLTSLSGDEDADSIRALCRKADTRWGRPAALCIHPEWVRLAVETLAEAGLRTDPKRVKVATVANFPGGDSSPECVAAEVLAARADGADEVDVVFPWRALQGGDAEAGERLVAAAREACGEGTLKVILETGALDAVAVREAARVAVDQGADFLKTSTGKIRLGATPAAVDLLLEVIRATPREVGLKVAGGVRTVQDAGGYLDQVRGVMGSEWMTPKHLRFGASSLLDDITRTLPAVSHLGPSQIAQLRAELESALEKLGRSMRISDEAVKPVELDQTTVGRLSRMDSLQSQSMAKSLHERERVKLALIQKALHRLDEGSYGCCETCGAEIPFGRLVIFPETPTCQSCG